MKNQKGGEKESNPYLAGSEKFTGKQPKEGNGMKYGNATLGQVEAVWNKLGGEEGVQCFLSGETVVVARGKESVVIFFKRDMTREGWKLLEDVPFDGKSFTPDIVKFLKPNESCVNGEKMKQRAEKLNANLGQHHAEYLLEHQELIPKEWRDKYYLAFTGTVWRIHGGDRRVPCLRWRGDRWCLLFSWLGHVWDSGGRLVCLRG